MIDVRSQSQFAEAAAEMMCAYAVAAARAASTSMFQGMSFWSRMLQASAMRPTPVFPAAFPVAWAAWSPAPTPEAETQAVAPPEQAPAEPPADAFASYRSAGGHAVAQVIVS